MAERERERDGIDREVIKEHQNTSHLNETKGKIEGDLWGLEQDKWMSIESMLTQVKTKNSTIPKFKIAINNKIKKQNIHTKDWVQWKRYLLQ